MENNSSNWNVDLYLERIGMERPEKPDRAYLDQLVEHHLIHIPFEALGLYTGREGISLELDKLFEKMVLNKRGGYCFELNKMFYYLLKELGYEVYSCFARIQMGEDVSTPISHRANIVLLDGKQLYCDVGYGNAMSRGAVELVADVRQQIGADVFWFEPYGRYWFDLCRKQQDLINEDGSITKGEPRRELRICIADTEDLDYELYNGITSSPGSPFSRLLMVGRLTENGALAINEDMVFSRIEGNHKTHRKLKDDAELWQVLKDEFGLF